MAPPLLVVTLMLLAIAVSISSSSANGSSRLNPQNTTTKWPTLQLSFTLKRNSMKVHGQSDFSMFADPAVSVDGEKVFYNVLSTFTEDSTIYNYTLINGAAFYSSRNIANATEPSKVACLDPEFSHLPPINAIVTALSEATAVSNAPRGVNCPNGSLFKVSVNDIDFALCVSESFGFKMFGDDMDIAVEYLDTRMNISAPTLNGESLSKCASVELWSEVTTIGNALLTGKPVSIDDSRRLKAEFDFSWGDSSTCSCKSTPRPCIFIHGMGVPYELPENQNSLKYWGNLTGHTPCCTTTNYAVLDTINNTWTNDTQQQKVCDRAVAVSKTSTDSVITDTIIISHSMGNLMLAGAIASGKCSIDSSSTWVGIAAPMKGSKASDFIQESCAGNTNFVLEGMVENSGRCPPTTALKSMPYKGESHSTPELDAAFTAAEKVFHSNVSAQMCSESFSGLRSPDQIKLWGLGMLGHHHSFRNDAMVEFQSCASGFYESKFGKTWRHRFYKTKLNHYDMQFKYGDGLFSKAKMPVKWLECLL